MYITMNNPSAHPSYSHYYLLSPSTLFFLFLYILLFFAHLVVFLHIFFAHLIVFCTSYCFLHILLFCTFFYFIAHFTLISPFLTICMPLCYVTLYNLYSYYFALSTERTWFDYISLLIIPCITIMWQIKKPWTLNLEVGVRHSVEHCFYGIIVYRVCLPQMKPRNWWTGWEKCWHLEGSRFASGLATCLTYSGTYLQKQDLIAWNDGFHRTNQAC